MTKEEQLLGKFRDAGVLCGGELLLDNSMALQFLNDCKTLGVIVLGMDFWIKDSGGFVEVSSADYSELMDQYDAVELSTEAASKLIINGFPDSADYVSFVTAVR